MSEVLIWSETEAKRETERDRQRQRETQRETERDRERQRERHSFDIFVVCNTLILSGGWWHGISFFSDIIRGKEEAR